MGLFGYQQYLPLSADLFQKIRGPDLHGKSGDDLPLLPAAQLRFLLCHPVPDQEFPNVIQVYLPFDDDDPSVHLPLCKQTDDLPVCTGIGIPHDDDSLYFIFVHHRHRQPAFQR